MQFNNPELSVGFGGVGLNAQVHGEAQSNAGTSARSQQAQKRAEARRERSMMNSMISNMNTQYQLINKNIGASERNSSMQQLISVSKNIKEITQLISDDPENAPLHQQSLDLLKQEHAYVLNA